MLRPGPAVTICFPWKEPFLSGSDPGLNWISGLFFGAERGKKQSRSKLQPLLNRIAAVKSDASLEFLARELAAENGGVHRAVNK